ncbi:MAG: TipAS antibiotic-recognition domain-containing protein [Oscillospiraceae bacterium]|nr:TipAS antibiotic-recognition domain-containing protein [Oscillospiraceae bacterium]
MIGDMDQIMARFAQCMTAGASPLSPEAQSLVASLQSHITDNYYLCTKEILFGLGQMYMADDRFRSNIDTHAPGTAEFIREAITAHCNNTDGCGTGVLI